MIESDQIGSAFGSTLAACDVDGDGLDELLVGNHRGGDQGRVYIYRIEIHTLRPRLVNMDSFVY